MNTKLHELKALIKGQAKEIKDSRRQTKERQKAHKYAGHLQSLLVDLKRDARHHLIAYAELKGKTRDQIEKPRNGNAPDEFAIARIKEAFTEIPDEAAEASDEALCDHAA